MSNAASFNLLKFVERSPRLSAGRIISIVLLCALIMLGYFLFQVDRIRDDTENSEKINLTMNKLKQTIQPLLQSGVGNPLVGVLSSGSLRDGPGFYPEFEALSHVQVKGLWLERVEIHRNPAFIKITGAMDDSDKLEQLLKQLGLQPAFKNIQFIGVDINKGLLPDVPKQYQAEIKQLKLPALYHFTIQTSPYKKSEVSV